jgi:hypothetical protein
MVGFRRQNEFQPLGHSAVIPTSPWGAIQDDAQIEAKQRPKKLKGSVDTPLSVWEGTQQAVLPENLLH